MMKRAGLGLLAVVVLLVAGWLLLPRLAEWRYLAGRRLDRSTAQVGEGAAQRDEGAITPQNAAQVRLIEQRGWGTIHDVAWAPDSRSLALVTTTGIRLVETGSLNLLGEIIAEAPVRAVAFSPDGSLVAGVVEGKGIALWAVDNLSFERLLEVPGAGRDEGSRGLQFSEDGRRVGITWHRTLFVWEVQTGRLQVEFQQQDVDLDVPRFLSFLPGEDHLLYADNAGLHTLDIANQVVVKTVPFEHKSDSIWAVDAAGEQIALARCSYLNLFAAGQDTPRYTLLLDDSCLKQAVFSADGQQLAALSALGIIYVISQDGSVLSFELGGQAYNDTWATIPLRFSPDGQSLAWVAAPWVLHLYRTADGSLTQTLRSPWAAIQAVHLESGEQGLMILDEGEQFSLASITLEERLASWEKEAVCRTGMYQAAGFSADGRLAWLRQCAHCTLRETETGSLVGVPLPCVEISALSPDGERWAVAYTLGLSEDPSRVEVYRTQDGELLYKFKTRAFYWRSLQFSPDGQLLLAVGDNGETYLWAGRQRVFRGVSGLGWRSVFTQDGLGLASGSMIVSLEERQETRLPGWEQYQVAVSPDGRVLARRAEDGSIELWDMTQVKQLHTLTFLPGWQALLTFSADGSRLLAVVDGVMAFWGVK